MLEQIAAEVINTMVERGETVAVAESCTGGMIASQLTGIAGSSQIFLGGVVAYSNSLKHRLLNVSLQTIEDEGSVSAACVAEMCQGVLENLASDYAISVTGIAGPGGATATKPVGLVYIAIGNAKIIRVFEFYFEGDRNEIRTQTVAKALELLLNNLQD